jgi:peptidoglycan biosynthesis protein MviN/MurJ (putative lipid II flippase)
MTQEEQRISTLVATCAKEVSAYILSYARSADLESAAFLVNVATVLVSSALAAQPNKQLLAASHHIQQSLRLVHCLQDEDNKSDNYHDG